MRRSISDGLVSKPNRVRTLIPFYLTKKQAFTINLDSITVQKYVVNIYCINKQHVRCFYDKCFLSYIPN